MTLDRFRQVWLVDFEFHQLDGERPEPICMAALEFRSGVAMRLGPDDMRRRPVAPFTTGSDAVLVAYYASAELGCFLALDWPLPTHVLDLFIEFSVRTNGLAPPCGRSLLGALTYFGLSGIPYAEKESMRQLAVRGGPYTAAEVQALTDYCESDVRALAVLLPRMQPFDLDRALLRGRYMAAAARMERIGTPIDVPTLEQFRANWNGIKEQLIHQVAASYTVTATDGGRMPIYDGATFKADRFAGWLGENRIPWPHLPTGRLDLADDTFRQLARLHPRVGELRELRHALSQLRLTDLAVGRDGRNRCLLSAFRSSTGRNQPSNSKFIFGSSVWLRGLICPTPGRFVAYLDWSGQEYGIAAALAGDEAMVADYLTGDPYLAFAKHLRLVPSNASKQTHPGFREAVKVALGLGAMYGAGANRVAESIGESVAFATHLLQRHRERYPRFWCWRDAAIDHALLHGSLHTVFGWRLHVGAGANPRSLANFPMQANGAEMLRLACIRTTEAGVAVCAPVHDALLIEGPADEADRVIDQARGLMARASRDVLGGFELRTGVEAVRYPDRYRDDRRGGSMWDRVMALLPGCPGVGQLPSHTGTPDLSN